MIKILVGLGPIYIARIGLPLVTLVEILVGISKEALALEGSYTSLVLEISSTVLLS